MIKVCFLYDQSNPWILPYIKSVDFKKINSSMNFEHVLTKDEAMGYDIVFVLGYTKILDEKFISSNKYNLVIHESDLPNGKGFSPMQWQILNGKSTITACLIDVAEKVDSGDIYETEIIELFGDELLGEIRNLQAKATLNLIKKFLKKYPNIKKEKQNGTESFFRRRNRFDDELDINKTIKEQFNNFRIADNENYPLYFYIDKNKYYLKIYKPKENDNK